MGRLAAERPITGRSAQALLDRTYSMTDASVHTAREKVLAISEGRRIRRSVKPKRDNALYSALQTLDFAWQAVRNTQRTERISQITQEMTQVRNAAQPQLSSLKQELADTIKQSLVYGLAQGQKRYREALQSVNQSELDALRSARGRHKQALSNVAEAETIQSNATLLNATPDINLTASRGIASWASEHLDIPEVLEQARVMFGNLNVGNLRDQLE